MPEEVQKEAMPKPGRLLPAHVGGPIEKSEAGIKTRQEALRSAPDLEGILQAQLKERNEEAPKNINLSLKAIEGFQRCVREAQDLRKVARSAQDPVEKAYASLLYGEQKKIVDVYLAWGLPFEKAYREYIRARNNFIHFDITLQHISKLEDFLNRPAFSSQLPEDKRNKLDERAHARLEVIVRDTDISTVLNHGQEIETLLEGLKLIYPEDSPEYQETKRKLLTIKTQELPQSKKEALEELERQRQQAQELWGDPMVRYFWQKKELEGLLSSFAKGKDVIEIKDVIKDLNLLHEWETQHQRTTIGGVLVGPPGVGKTTLLRHYLEAKGRNYIYIDLSEDVTRYLLYGSKSLEFKSPAEYHKNLMERLHTLEGAAFKNLVIENSTVMKSVFGAREDEAVVAAIDQLQEDLAAGKGVSPEIDKEIAEMQAKVNTLAQQAFRAELAQEFAHLVKRNGWRDGAVIAALRRGDSIIFDEFNKNKNWSLLFGLMTAKPGEDWYFADNDEHIKIPDDWRMYFTANIGRKHGGFEVAEALASRAGGKVMEINYPSPKPEMQVALVALSDAEGDLLRSKDDLARLYVLIYEAFPKIRSFIEDQRQVIPISFRTIRDLAEKLVLQRDPKTGIPVYQATAKSFDEAVYEMLVGSYALYEDKTAPKEIVNLLTSVGILLDDRVKDKVVPAWMDNDTYEERQRAFAEHKEDFTDIVKKIKGTQTQSSEAEFPIQLNIKSLTLEEPQVRKAQLLFDPEKDIPENIWQDLGRLVSSKFSQFKNDENQWEPYLEVAANIALLSPDKKNILRFDDAVMFGLPEVIHDIEFWGKVAVINAPSRKQFKNIMGNDEIGINLEELRKKMEKARGNVEESGKLFHLLENGVAVKTYSPERFKEIGSDYFDGELFGLIQENINQVKNNFQPNEEPTLISQQVALLSFAKILYPDRFKAIQSDPGDWKRFHQTLEQLANLKRWEDYLKLAVGLKILTAEELRFSEEKGLEIILPDPTKSAYIEATPPIPEIRKF